MRPTNDGHGVYARNWYGPTRQSPTRVNYTMDVWLRDRYGGTGFGPGGNAIVRLRYRYSFYRSSVSLWALVTTYAAPNAAGTPFVKEPKFTALTRGGGFRRMAVFEDRRRALREGHRSRSAEGTAVLKPITRPTFPQARPMGLLSSTSAEGSPRCSATCRV